MLFVQNIITVFETFETFNKITSAMNSMMIQVFAMVVILMAVNGLQTNDTIAKYVVLCKIEANVWNTQKDENSKFS